MILLPIWFVVLLSVLAAAAVVVVIYVLWLVWDTSGRWRYHRRV